MKKSTITIGISEERIAARAFQLWMARGRPVSDGSEDWFAARAELEAELTRAIAPKATAPKRKAPAKKVAQIEA